MKTLKIVPMNATSTTALIFRIKMKIFGNSSSKWIILETSGSAYSKKNLDGSNLTSSQKEQEQSE